ncbi:hypothetical protein Tco_1571676 [Tanacetum coccineum]
MSIKINKKKELQQLEQAGNLSTYTTEPLRHFNSFYDDDDYEASTIPLNDIISQIPPSIAITPVLPTIEPEDSLNMGDEHLNTIPKKESPINIYEGNSVTFSNPLFNSIDDFTSSDDESLSDEDIPEDKSNLFFYANEDECFDPGRYIDEIDAFLDMDNSTKIEDNYHDSEGDIIYLESLLIDGTFPNLPPKEFLDHDPKSLNDKPDNDDLNSMVKVFYPGIHETVFSPTYVKLPFEDRHYLSLTYVIRIFLPYFTYPVDSSLPLSSGSEDIIFDPNIFALSFYSLEPVAYENPMKIFPFFNFCPNDKGIRGESS